MPKATFNRNVTIGGRTYQQSFDVPGNGQVVAEMDITAGTVGGTLTVRGSNTAGTVNFPNGSPFVTNDVIDIFWPGGSRRGMTATVTGNNVALTGGAGDNLPALNQASIVAKKPQVLDFVLTGNNVQCFIANSPVIGWIVFLASDGTTVLYTARIVAANGQVSWNLIDGGTNPVAGDAIAKVSFSHGDSNTQQMRSIFLYS